MATETTMTPKEASRELNVSLDTLRRWEAQGKISATRTPGGQRRFDPIEVRKIKEGKQ